MDATNTGPSPTGDPSAIRTVPNAISLVRILLIPLFCYLIVHRPTTLGGIALFSLVVATDWVDGVIARRTGQVSDLGKVLDPVADRLAIAAGLASLVIRGAFPLWAALLILVRDGAILVAGAALLSARHVRLDVRFIGKTATFCLMAAIPWISWGHLGYPLSSALLVGGWACFWLGIIEYYIATGAYVLDIRRALSTPA
ncbi:MAG: CDP-alcohol phosphatidyltransferase family protein [Actinomycetota bacterium]